MNVFEGNYMDLLSNILLEVLLKCPIQVSIAGGDSQDFVKIAHNECLSALLTIQSILAKEELSDYECVEEILCIMDGLGGKGTGRHS